MKSPGNYRVGWYKALALVVSPLCLFILVAGTALPVVRRYTVVNRTGTAVYVTPLLNFTGDDGEAAALASEPAGKNVMENVRRFAVLSQYRTYGFPALPARANKDLRVEPGQARVLYVDFEDLNHEQGAQVLLVRHGDAQYRYLEADFWEQNTIRAVADLPVATTAMMAAKNEAASWGWVVPWGLLGAAVLFPLLWHRAVRLGRKEEALGQ